jgi:hypothetical protein
MSTTKYVYRIFNRETGELVGSYSRAYRDEYDFTSVEQARSANCHDLFKNESHHRIAKIEVTETIVDEDAK